METLFILVIVFFLMHYFLNVRPEKQRRKEDAEMRGSLKNGDEVTMMGGIVGTICAVKDNTIVIETGADRVRIEYATWGVLGKGVLVSNKS